MTQTALRNDTKRQGDTLRPTKKWGSDWGSRKVDQGVYIGELHNLEALSQSKAYVFCYIAATNKIKGTAAGFALRPLALR